MRRTARCSAAARASAARWRWPAWPRTRFNAANGWWHRMRHWRPIASTWRCSSGAAKRSHCAPARRCTCTSAPATRRAAWPCSMQAMRWPPAHAPACSWCCSGRWPRGMATAWCCATRRPRARWPAAVCSIRSRRRAIGARRSVWPSSTPRRSTRRRRGCRACWLGRPAVSIGRAGCAPRPCSAPHGPRCRPMRCVHASTAHRRSCSRPSTRKPLVPRRSTRCRPTTRATSRSSAPMRRGCGAWPCRSCPRRCGASCWRG